jgi:Arc/MetJ family transcription regulator
VRTTLTLDDDVAALVKLEIRRSGSSLKATVNNLLRKGLANGNGEERKPFVVTPLPLGTGLGTRYETVNDLIEALEGPNHR